MLIRKILNCFLILIVVDDDLDLLITKAGRKSPAIASSIGVNAPWISGTTRWIYSHSFWIDQVSPARAAWEVAHRGIPTKSLNRCDGCHDQRQNSYQAKLWQEHALLLQCGVSLGGDGVSLVSGGVSLDGGGVSLKMNEKDDYSRLENMMPLLDENGDPIYLDTLRHNSEENIKTHSMPTYSDDIELTKHF